MARAEIEQIIEAARRDRLRQLDLSDLQLTTLPTTIDRGIHPDKFTVQT